MKNCWKCKEKLGSGDDYCFNCGSEQPSNKGMFLWTLLGVVLGWTIPFLIGIPIILLFVPKRIITPNQDLLNNIALRRWLAIRKGWIISIIIQSIALLPFILFCSMLPR